MNKIINDNDILKMLREEWHREVANLLEKKQERKKPKKKPENVKLEPEKMDNLAAGLRIKHRESKLEYTIVGSDGNNVTLLTPEGQEITLPKIRLKREYALD